MNAPAALLFLFLGVVLFAMAIFGTPELITLLNISSNQGTWTFVVEALLFVFGAVALFWGGFAATA